jgi:hypothetical protein
MLFMLKSAIDSDRGSNMAVNVHPSIFTELADFLISQPSLEDFAVYRVSDSLQEYIDSQLERNSEGSLSNEDRIELERILAVSHLMTLVKTKAKLKLASQS